MHVCKIRNKASVDKSVTVFFAFSQAGKPAVVIVDRIRIILLILQVNFCIVRIDAQPGSSPGEAGMFCRTPLKWSPGVVPAVFLYHMKGISLRHTLRKRNLVGVNGRDVIHLVNG